MEINLNKKRRLNNVKSWCFLPIDQVQKKTFLSFRKKIGCKNTSSKNTIKIHFRNFRNKYQTIAFIRAIKSRYRRRYKNEVKIRPNYNLTKIEYYSGVNLI